MCKTRKSTLVASAPSPRPPKSSSSSTMPSSSSITFHTSTTFNNSTSFSSESLATLRDSLRETHIIYPFPEILAATNNLLSLSSPSTSCRCSLRGLDALLLHLPLRASPAAVPARLANLCRSHHTSIPRLLGASLPVDATRIYLAYEYIPGANLSDCLRNPRNPGFTPLSSWISRIQIATDLAQGLEYIHHHSSSSFKIHNRIKSSAVIVTDPGFRAKICHFGAAELSGEIPISSTRKSSSSDEDEEEERRLSNGGGVRIEGTRGYMAPEVLAGGRISQASDVFAFGVVILELLSGEEPLKYRFENGRIEMMSLLETARETYGEEEDGGVEGRQGRIRQWMDRRLRDSFPVEVAEKLIRVALRCVDVKPGARPDMVWVAGKVSRMFLDSVAWEERVGAAPNFSVSLAPR